MLDNTRKFVRQITTLMTGATLANITPILVTPILSRLYTPVDFGIMALFISLTTIFGSIANGRFELAIVLPREHRAALTVTLLAMLLALGLGIFMLPTAAIFNRVLTDFLRNESISFWLYFLPISIFLFGVTNPLNYLHIREENYRTVASAKITRALTLALIQLTGGFLGWGGSGLILGFLGASLMESSVLLFQARTAFKTFRAIRFTELREQMKRYIRFPKYSVPGALSNTMSTYLVDLLIPAFFSTVLLGYYALINRILGLPLKMIGNSISQVYFQKAAEEKNETGNSSATFRRTMFLLLGVALPLFILIFFFIEDLFGIVFGPDWTIAGKYAKLLLPLFFIRFVVSPISVTCSIYEKQGFALIWQISLLVALAVLFYVTRSLNLGFESFLTGLTWSSFVLYMVMLIYVIRLSMSKPTSI